MTWNIYIIECSTPNTLYVGQTRQFHKRLLKHRRGGTAFTAKHGVKTVSIIATVSSREEAIQVETATARELVEQGFAVGGVSVTRHA